MEKQINQEKVWDTISSDWIKYRKHSLKQVRDFLKNKTGKILDLGCGSGRNFQENKGIIYGIDFSKKMLNYAKQTAEIKKLKVILKKMDVSNLKFKDNFFDSALFIAVLHSIPTSEKRKKALLELNRVLKPGSEIIITVWDKNQKRFENFEKQGCFYWKSKSKKHPRYLYLYNKQELTKLLQECRFKILKILGKQENLKFTNKNIIIYARVNK